MKLFPAVGAILLAFALSGCQVSQLKTQAPLHTSHEQVAPPPGCAELRRRGGAC